MASQSGIMASSPAGQREAAARSLAAAGVTVREGVRATRVGPPAGGTAEASSSSTLPSAASLTFTSPAAEGETTEEYDAVCWAVGQRVESPEAWPFPRDQRSKKIVTDATLRVSGHARVFALGDVASATGEAAAAAAANVSSSSSTNNAAAPPPAAFPSTAQVAFQQADYAAWNLWASIAERPLLPFKYQHLGDMMVLGKVDAAVALPVGDATIDGRGTDPHARTTFLRLRICSIRWLGSLRPRRGRYHARGIGDFVFFFFLCFFNPSNQRQLEWRRGPSSTVPWPLCSDAPPISTACPPTSTGRSWPPTGCSRARSSRSTKGRRF